MLWTLSCTAVNTHLLLFVLMRAASVLHGGNAPAEEGCFLQRCLQPVALSLHQVRAELL
jgi:hypothetical protein